MQETKKETKKTPSRNSGKEQEKGLQSYVDAAKAGIERAWKLRYLWFWGIFIPTGGGGINIPVPGEDSGSGDEEFEEMWTEVGEFITNYWYWVLLAVGLMIALIIFFWILSAIVRSGIAKSLSKVQDTHLKTSSGFGDVWRGGKIGAGRIILLDIASSFVGIIAVVILLIPVLLVLLGEIYWLLIVLIPLEIFILLAFFIPFSYLKQTAIVLVALFNFSFIESIKNGFLLLKNNWVEALKLFLTNMVIGIVSFFAIIALVIPVILVIIFGGISVGLLASTASTAGIVAGIVIAAVFFLVFFVLFSLVKSILSIWKLDILVWWVKKVSKIKKPKSPEEKKEEELEAEEEKVEKEIKAVPETAKA